MSSLNVDIVGCLVLGIIQKREYKVMLPKPCAPGTKKVPNTTRNEMEGDMGGVQGCDVAGAYAMRGHAC